MTAPIEPLSAGGAPLVPLRAIGVAVPVRNEEGLLKAALDALIGAAHHPCIGDLAVSISIVLDGCRDGCGDIARASAEQVNSRSSTTRILVVETTGGNVGAARHLGLLAVLEDLSDTPLAATWLATTDADSRVPVCWLANQIKQRDLGVEAWAGTVAVEDWGDRPELIGPAFRAEYERALPRGHVHGTTMGFAAATYLRHGGFPPANHGRGPPFMASPGGTGRSPATRPELSGGHERTPRRACPMWLRRRSGHHRESAPG